VSAGIGGHVSCTSPAAHCICTSEIRAGSPILKEFLSTIARKENPQRREIDALVRREPAPTRTFADQPTEIEPFSATDAAFDATDGAECQEWQTDAAGSLCHKR
jgi:hypothetical protein